MELRALQRPLKARYRESPEAARIRLVARGSQSDLPTACSVDLGRAVQAAEAHEGVGGSGAGACSGDLLLGALAACAQITAQMVAASLEIPVRSLEAVVEGDLDLRGTLGVDREAPVGFEQIGLRLEVDAPEASEEQLSTLEQLTERYCVILQTLTESPRLTTVLVRRPLGGV